MVAAGVTVAILLLSCAGEGDPAPVAEPGVVARVGPRVIDAEDLRDFVRLMPVTLRSRQTGDAARREYLRSLMARHLLALEAAERGLDTVAVVARRSEARWRQHLIQLYRREELAPRVEVTEEEVQRYFDANEMARERQLAAIVVHSEAAAREVLDRLAAGDAFEALAAEVSADERSAADGGVLGFISLGEARRLKIPEEVFRNLKSGEIGPIVPVGRSFQVLRFLDEREAGIDEHREAIERVIYEYKFRQQESEHVRDLAEEYSWRVDAGGLRALVEAAGPRGCARRRDLEAGAAGLPLFHHAGGEVRMGDFVDAVWSNPSVAAKGWGTADSASVVEAARQLVLGREMLLVAARRGGMADRPDERAWRERVTEEFAIQELRRREAVAPSRVSGDEAREFYEAHREAFLRPMEAYIIEVLVRAETEAEQVLAEVSRGRALAGLAEQLSLRDGAREQSGIVVVDAHVRLGHPKLYRAVETAPLDEIVGPVAVSGGYSVFQVIHREGGDVLPFAEVESRARAFARKERKDDLLAELIEERLESLGDGVVVYDHELAMALPDSLLETVPASPVHPPGSP